MKFDKIKYSIDNFEIAMNKPTFMILELDIVSDGVNRHSTEFMRDDIEKSIPKLNNIPLNCGFTASQMDFKEHAWTEKELKEQRAIGTIPETNKAQMVEKDGRSFLRVNAIVWKYLFPQAEEILTRRKKVAISMEIEPLDGYKDKDTDVMVITDWDYNAITLLGYNVTPAIPNADATVVKYSSNEDYFEKTMIEYGALVDSYSIPDRIKVNIEVELGKEQTNPNTITEAFNVFNKDTLNYSEIIALKDKIISLDEDSQALLSGDEFLKWTDAIEKERNGGTVDLKKLKELFVEKFSDGLKYFSHNETAVFCFDYESAQFKSFKYTYEEAEEVNLTVEEDFETVVKLEGSDEFKVASEVTDEDAVEDAVMYSISAFSAMQKELNSCKDKMSEDEEKIKDLETEKEAEKTKFSDDLAKVNEDLNKVNETKASLEEKVLSYASLETELVELRAYKADKEKAEKQSDVNKLYSKYSEYLTEDETTELNAKVESIDIAEFTKEVYSIVMPKIEANLDALKQVENLGKEEQLKFNKSPLPKEDGEKKKYKSQLEKLNEI